MPAAFAEDHAAWPQLVMIGYAAVPSVQNCCRQPLDLGRALWRNLIHKPYFNELVMRCILVVSTLFPTAHKICEGVLEGRLLDSIRYLKTARPV